MTTTTKPRITPTGDERFRVTFPDGRVAQIWRSDRDTWNWLAEGTELLVDGCAVNFDHAFRGAYAAGFQAPKPLDIELDALRVDRMDTTAFAKLMRGLLKKRTGFAWSVTIGSGTGYCWVDIKARKSRAHGDFHNLTAADQALLYSILGHGVSASGFTVDPDRGRRAWVAEQVANRAAHQTGAA